MFVELEKLDTNYTTVLMDSIRPTWISFMPGKLSIFSCTAGYIDSLQSVESE